MIEFNQVSLHRGIKPLLKHADLRIHDGQKLALIGPNGAGKSSLFALLLGELGVEEGELYLPTGWRIAHMAQEVEATDRCAVDYVIDGDKIYREIEHGIETTTCDNELANWHSKMDAHNGYNIKVQAEQLLHGLGFKQSDMIKPVSGFSGGWRIRLNLAQALMTPSDLLLLDEPTNHLDLDATLWLEQWLNKYQGTLVFISHDRDFIDGVADHIVHLHQQTLTSYPGNYSAYERIRAERLAQQQVMHDKQQVRIAEIEKFVTRFRAKASKAKQAQSRMKELERMELIAPAHVDSPFSFSFTCADKVSTPLLNLETADIGYQGKNGGTAVAILENQNISLVPGHRIGLLGANGAGKSTLIKTLCEELPQLSGKRHEGEHLKLGYYAQHQLETLDVKASPMLMIQRITPSATDQEVRNFLGGFDFRGEKALEACEPFSGGEKARLALALVAWQKPNLLIMDEPTNHLDIDMREALTMALQTFAGAIVLVSHDRHLLKATVDEYWLVEDGKVALFEGDLDDYHKHVQAKQAASGFNAGQLATNPNSADSQGSGTSENKAAGSSAQDRKEQKRLDAERRARLAPMRKELNKLDTRMEKLQSILDESENQLGDTALYEAERKADLQKILQQQGDAKSEMEDVEMQWMELSEEMEAAE
ncbi:MAG: ATP-binding cassette domain-containing protein [Oleispira sp.]|nr:ATP-binding cassette domain-containing protein [Oleispira sp.]MBL4881008.1 ATP-binding cassette domain-containing protein [Oleispira sp.]